jgi:metal-sulfur cluster biosynthetic enzyme
MNTHARMPDRLAYSRRRSGQALAHLADPEIPVVSLRELGILREVREGATACPKW